MAKKENRVCKSYSLERDGRVNMLRMLFSFNMGIYLFCENLGAGDDSCAQSFAYNAIISRGQKSKMHGHDDYHSTRLNATLRHYKLLRAMSASILLRPRGRMGCMVVAIGAIVIQEGRNSVPLQWVSGFK